MDSRQVSSAASEENFLSEPTASAILQLAMGMDGAWDENGAIVAPSSDIKAAHSAGERRKRRRGVTKADALPYDELRTFSATILVRVETTDWSRESGHEIFYQRLAAVLTDSHFLVPLLVFCIGLALLITLH